MADKLNVERLFSLPYFQQMFDQMIKPLNDSLGQIHCAEDGLDPELYARITEEANRYIYQGLTGIMMDFFVDVLTDEDVDFLRAAYQHPAFLKLQLNLQSTIPMMIAWFEDNQEIIRRSIKTALDRTV